MTFLNLKNVEKKLGDKNILKDINLDVNRGEIIGLVGPSGSGKSTLLRCINRLIEIDKGKIIFQGDNIKKLQPVELRRKIVMLHQESVMFEGSVYENISYGLKILNSINDEYIADCIKYAGLSESFLNKNAQKLSGGEKKRVALARALALKPKILLLDEPTSGVDPKNVEKVEKNIVGFSKDLDLTVLWVTHYVEQAKRVCQKIANVKDGLIRSVEKTADFKWEGAY